jgi:hypothetical protein
MASRQNQLTVLQYLISYVSNIDVVNKIVSFYKTCVITIV